VLLEYVRERALVAHRHLVVERSVVPLVMILARVIADRVQLVAHARPELYERAAIASARASSHGAICTPRSARSREQSRRELRGRRAGVG
jgi:hypothetical protein